MASPAAAEDKAAPQKSKKDLTKAERRAIQERQRAEKAARNNAGPSRTSTKGESSNNAGGRGSSSQNQQGSKGQGSRQAPSASTDTTGSPNQPQSTSSTTQASSQGNATTSNRSSPSSLALFGHLDPPRSTRALFPIKGYVHPSVLALATMYADMKVVGANARCMSMLEAFKDVIRDYQVPPGNSLSRHLPTHLSPQINHLVKARPMATSMGNAIRYLKWEIAQIPIDMPDDEARNLLCKRIDHFVRDRIILAGKVIEDHAIGKIEDGAVVLTYSRSSLVEGILVEAKRRGKDFSVIVVDGKPMHEGKRLLERLVSEGISTTYVLVSGLGSVLPDVSLVLLGTHSLLSNGSLYARSGTAMVALMAKVEGKPVVACCETYKFSDRIMLDSIVDNEMGSTSSLLSQHHKESGMNLQDVQKALDEISEARVTPLSLLYDVTRPQDVTCVICEVAIIPVQSVPVAMRDYKPISST